MQLAAPIYRLKRAARALARAEGLTHVQALDRIATREGFRNWSHLAATCAAASPAVEVYRTLSPGELVLLAARPGQGKTLFGLELALQAVKARRHAIIFSLECTGPELATRLHQLGTPLHEARDFLTLDISDDISADTITARLAGPTPGSLVVVDYLQILDQRRDTPPLSAQIATLSAFARRTGVIFAMISQIDRRFETSGRAIPDRDDIRLPNPVDLSLFDKACFLNQGKIHLEDHP